MCERRSLADLSLRLALDDGLWVRRNSSSYYVDPAAEGFLTLESINWMENPLTLNQSPRSKQEPKAEQEHQKKFQEEVRKALYFIGGMLGLIVLLLTLK